MKNYRIGCNRDSKNNKINKDCDSKINLNRDNKINKDIDSSIDRSIDIFINRKTSLSMVGLYLYKARMYLSIYY
jgi:hypothetical protein